MILVTVALDAARTLDEFRQRAPPLSNMPLQGFQFPLQILRQWL